MISRYAIGPAVIAIESPARSFDADDENLFYRHFEIQDARPADIVFTLRWDTPPARETTVVTAELPENWCLFSGTASHRLEIVEPIQSRIKQTAVFNSAWSQADVYLADLPGHRADAMPVSGWALVDLMEPLVQWWLSLWLARTKGGVVFHGSAVAWGNIGLAFVGPSEAGKTTNARLFRDHGQAIVLNDERIVIWKEQGAWRVGGSPWHGELHAMSPRLATLRRLSLLDKSDHNALSDVSPVEAIRWLSQEAFWPFWDPQAMHSLLETITGLAQEPWCQKLTFRKDAAVVNFLRRHLEPSVAPLPPAEVMR